MRRRTITVAVIMTVAWSCSDDDATGDGGAPDAARDAGAREAAVVEAGVDAPVPDGASSCGAHVTFATGKKPITTLHVALTGSDSVGDGTAAKPYRSVAHAVKQAKPGTAVQLGVGTYSGGVTIKDLHGTAAAPIWIGGAPGKAKPVLEGGSEGLHLTRVRYLVVHDLEVRKNKQNGINCDDGGEYANATATHHVVFSNLYVHDVGGAGNQDCLKLSGLRDYFVLGSTFEKCGGGMSGSGVDHVGCHRGVIARNTFRNLSGNAVQCKGGSVDILVAHNLLVEPGARGVNMGGSTGFTFFRPPLSKTATNAEARNIRVVANVIKGGNAPFAFVGCVDCLAANNTIIDPHSWLLRILQETKTSGGYTFAASQKGRVVNNLFYFDRQDLSTYVNIGPNTLPKTFSFESNLWYAHDQPSASAPSNLPVAETGGVVAKDPKLTSAAKGDYSIGATSPAAGKGKGPAAVAGDMAGRCYANPPSIGAHEAPGK